MRETTGHNGSEESLPTPDGNDEVFVFPASFGQQRLWFLDQFEPGSPYYNIPIAFRLSGRFDIDVFEQTINEIVRRHEVLRTVFKSVDGKPMQIILPEMLVTVACIDLEQFPYEQREQELRTLAQAEGRAPFNLSTGPLFRARVIRVSSTDHVALVTMHHIISDGWSIGVFIGEISRVYPEYDRGRPSPLPELAIQYADFAEWQRSSLQGDVLEKELAYWKSNLAGAPEVLDLPTDRPRSAVYTNAGATESLKLSVQLTHDVYRLARQEGVTLFMLLLGGLQSLLSRYSGQKDICIGTPIANRTQGETEALIGLFINTIVLRSDLTDDPRFTDLLQRVRRTTLDAYSHQDLPFEMLVDALQLDRDMSHTPLFQVMLIVQNAPSRVQQLPGLTLTPIDVELGTSTCDLTLSVTEGLDGISIDAEYNTDLFDATTIQRMMKHYEHILEEVARNPHHRVSQIPMLSSEERSRMLVEWNDFAEPRPESCVHELFQREAQQQPNDTAVVCNGRRLSYFELDIE